MESMIYNYALIKALYDENQSLSDGFIAFVIRCFNNDTFIDDNTIKRNLISKYQINMPSHVLDTVLHKCRQKGYLQRKGQRHQITNKGQQFYELLETDDSIKRRINSLVYDIKIYYTENKALIEDEKILDVLNSFIEFNLYPLLCCINPSFDESKYKLNLNGENDKILFDYIIDAKNKKPEHFNTIMDLLYGSLISTVLYTEDKNEYKYLENKEIGYIEAYLDTNLIFSFLGLHSDETNLKAKELRDLLLKNKMILNVFSFTIDEITGVLNGYIMECNKYVKNIPVDHIYYYLKSKGWKASDSQMYMINIEKILEDNDIHIKYVDKINLKNFMPDNLIAYSKIDEYKDVMLTTKNHDIAAIEQIIKLRKNPIRHFEKSQYIFLTSDRGLSKFNLIEYNHNEDGTICEVILDRTLTNILWLKNPNIQPPIYSIISAFSKELFIKKRIWDKFYDELNRLAKEGKISHEDITMLLYSDRITDVLNTYDESDIDKITPDLILDEIKTLEESKTTIRKDITLDIKEEYDKIIKDKEIEIKEKSDLEWYNKISNKKEEIKNNTMEIANKLSIFAIFLMSILLAIILIPFLNIFLTLQLTSGMEIVIQTIIGLISFGGLFKKFLINIKIYIFNIIFKYRIKNIDVLLNDKKL